MRARPRPACRRCGVQIPKKQRIAQEQEAARTSHLFATTNVAPGLGAAAIAAASRPLSRQRPRQAAASTDLTSQDHKLAFLNGNVDRRTTSPDRVAAAGQSHMCCKLAR